MGSYNYDMLQRQTSGMKRAWWGMPIAAQQPSYRALEPLYVGQGGYGSFNGSYDGLYAGAMPLAAAADRDLYGSSRLPPMGPWAMPDVREPVLLPEPESPLSSPSSSAPEEEPPLAGMIFGCTSNTFMDCMQLRLFALPAANQKDVSPFLFLFFINKNASFLKTSSKSTNKTWTLCIKCIICEYIGLSSSKFNQAYKYHDKIKDSTSFSCLSIMKCIIS